MTVIGYMLYGLTAQVFTRSSVKKHHECAHSSFLLIHQLSPIFEFPKLTENDMSYIVPNSCLIGTVWFINMFDIDFLEIVFLHESHCVLQQNI